MSSLERRISVDTLPVAKNCGLETVAGRPKICIYNESRFGKSTESSANCFIYPRDSSAAKPFESLPAQDNL